MSRTAAEMALLRAMPRVRLQPVTKTRLTRCASKELARRLVVALNATGRYTATHSQLFKDETFLFTNAPDDLLLILAGGGRAVVTASITRKREAKRRTISTDLYEYCQTHGEWDARGVADSECPGCADE